MSYLPAILSGVVASSCFIYGVRTGAFGTNTLVLLQSDKYVKYTHVTHTSPFGIFDMVKYWTEYGYRGPHITPPVFSTTKFYFRPVRIYQINIAGDDKNYDGDYAGDWGDGI